MTERETIAQALRDAGGKIGAAARALGVSRRTLQSRMREHGMARGKAGRPKRHIGGKKKRAGWLAAGTAAAVVAGIAIVRQHSKA